MIQKRFIVKLLLAVALVVTVTLTFRPRTTHVQSQKVTHSACVISGTPTGVKADHRCTPGAVLQKATKDEICVPGYTHRVRDVSAADRRRIYRSYGIEPRARYGQPGSYEIDHLVPLELGGNNTDENLWPEQFPDYAAKDQWENYWHDQACFHHASLKDAQQWMIDHYVR